MNEQQIDQLRAVADHAEQVNSAVYLAPRSLRSLLDLLDQAEARIRHLEDTARVLAKEALTAEDVRDEHRRGKAAAEARVAEEKRLRMKATAAATKAEARIKAVEDVLDTEEARPRPIGGGYDKRALVRIADIRRALEG